jgi:hypothetical protein
VDEELKLKVQEKRRVEQELAIMAKEKAILHAELAAQRVEKQQMEKHFEGRSPARFLDDSRVESSAFLYLKHEIEILKGEVRAGYNFMTALPSTTSRSSNSGGDSGVSAPCSSRTGNTCTPRPGNAYTPRLGNGITPRTGNVGTPRTGNISQSKDLPMLATVPDSADTSFDHSEALALDLDQDLEGPGFVAWGF